MSALVVDISFVVRPQAAALLGWLIAPKADPRNSFSASIRGTAHCVVVAPADDE
jgi:hypothetical protein